MADDRLDAYRRKRDLDTSPEPAGARGAGGSEPRFVIQEHAASTHHYDLRLEVDDVLVSWAVPKGPSTDPRERRLAVRTEDHPLDYADFEGHIPQEAYGGGDVIVWDTGPMHNLSTGDDGEPVPLGQAIEERGHCRVWLDGQKVRGGYDLVHARVGGDEDNWLLRKLDDDEADARRRPTSTERASVLTDRTIDDVADEQGA